MSTVRCAEVKVKGEPPPLPKWEIHFDPLIFAKLRYYAALHKKSVARVVRVAVAKFLQGEGL